MNVKQYYYDNFIDATNQFIGCDINSGNVGIGGTNGSLNEYLFITSNSNLYLANSNLNGEIRFKVKNNINNPDYTPDYTIKIDEFGKLKAYHIYNPLQPTFPSGFYDIKDEVMSLKADGINTDIQLTVLDASVVAIQGEIIAINDYATVLNNTISAFADKVMPAIPTTPASLNIQNQLNSLGTVFSEVRSSTQAQVNSVLTWATLGTAGAVLSYLGYNSLTEHSYRGIDNIKDETGAGYNETDKTTLRRKVIDQRESNVSNFNFYSSNMVIEQGFINSNITNQQFIPTLKSNKVLLGNITTPNSSYQMEMTGDLNLNELYRNSTSLTSLLNQKQGNLTFNNPLLNTIDIITLKKDSTLTLDGSGNLSVAPSTASKWTTSGTNIYNTFLSGNVGIGNSAPIATLCVGNSSVIGSDGSIVIGKCSAVSTFRHFKMGIDANYNFCIGDFGANNIAGTWLNTQFAINYGTGNVGIGVAPSTYKLNVNGTLNCSGNFTGGGNDNIIANTTNGGVNFKIRNNSTGVNAYSGIGIVNSVGNGATIFLNSSTRTADGGINTATLRNDVGDLRLSASGDNPYIYLKSSSGNIGIGSMIPAYKLDVIGDINFTGSLRQNGVLFQSGTPSQWTTNGTSIYYNSNVGVGITTPQTKLHISSALTTAGMSFPLRISAEAYANLGNNTGTFMALNTENVSWTKCALGHVRTSSFDQGAIVFLCRDTADTVSCDMTNERMRISANGNVSINCNLDIGSSLAITGGTTTYNELGVPVDSGNQTNTYITFKQNGSANDWCYLRQIGGNDSYKLSFDFHDAIDARLALRAINSVANPDQITEVFSVDNGNVSMTGNIDVAGDWYWKQGKNFRLQATANNYEFSFDLENQNTITGTSWQIWSDKINLGSLLMVRGDNGNIGVRNDDPVTSGNDTNFCVGKATQLCSGSVIIAQNTGGGSQRKGAFSYDASYNLCLGDYGGTNSGADPFTAQLLLYYQSPWSTLETYANGDVNIYGNLYQGSDHSYKTDINTIENALWKICQLRGVEYIHVIEGDRKLGLIAQEVEYVIPEAVSKNNKGNKCVSYTEIVPVLINSIKELTEIIDNQNTKINELRSLLVEQREILNRNGLS